MTTTRAKKKPAPAADAAAIRHRLVKMASELSKMRPPCDFCTPGVELSVHLGGDFVLCDVLHEPGCSFTDHLREQLITADEFADAIDDEVAGA